MSNDQEYEAAALEGQDRIAMMTDKELVAAYQATDGQPGNVWADMLAAALQERDVDF